MENKVTLPEQGERKQYEMLLLSVKEIKGRSNSVYCILELQPSPNDRKVTAKMWKTTKQQVTDIVPEMSVATLYLKGDVYDGNIQYIADTITPGKGRAEDYIPVSKIDGSRMYDYLTGLISKHCKDHPAVDAALSIYEVNREKLVYYPAALSVHHSCNGGLLMHTGTCACLCYKLAPVISPEAVRQVLSLETKAVMNGIFSLLWKSASGPLAEAAKSIFRTFHTTHREEAVEKYLTMMILQKISRSYPFLDTDLLFSACAVRNASVFTDDPMARLVGICMSDLLLVKKALSGQEIDGESSKLLCHCVLVSEQTDRRAAVPEAYLLMKAEQIAHEAVINAAADNASYSTGTVIIAAALHDIGKIRELDASPMGRTEYSADGNMFGHPAMGVEMYIDALDRTGTEMDEETGAVANCIAAHHGKSEWGALTEPASFEAKVLSLVDHIDSRMDIFERCGDSLPEGGRDESVRRYIGNAVYKPVRPAKDPADSK